MVKYFLDKELSSKLLTTTLKSIIIIKNEEKDRRVCSEVRE